jgi:hypothetical protein
MRNEFDKAKWEAMRSHIYIRDKGVCCVCKGFTKLIDYDLGHIVDMCNGGKATYNNLAVMHNFCNSHKPKTHCTIEDAIKWRAEFTSKYQGLKYGFRVVDKYALESLIVEYFEKHPTLLTKEDNATFEEKTKAIAYLSETLGVTIYRIHRCIDACILYKHPFQDS